MKPIQIALILMCAATSAEAAPTFTVVTTGSGVQALRDSKPSDWWLSGLSFVDLDHDGDLDLFFSDHHGAGLAALNDGKGNFAAAGGTYPTSEVHIPLDVDEDGKVDMDMTYLDGGAKWWLNKTIVGSSTLQFTDVGVVDTRDGNQSRSEALVDLNRDGKLDWVRGCQGKNFKVDFGDGAGNFTADSLLIPQPQGDAQDAGMMFADLDADGDEDMIINWGGYSSPGINSMPGVDYGRVRVLMNDGKMNLVEKTTEIGLPTDHLAILGIGDIDQDGDVDLIGLADRQFPEVIYVNDGHGSFSVLPNAVTGVSGSSEYALWGLATVTDLDNDGIADILIDGRFFFHVLRGTGGGHFAYQNDAWGNITHTAEASVDSGFAFGDIDSDGDLDLMGYTAGDPNRQVALYRNDLPAQHWLNVRPVGLAGNKEGVNSKIRVYEANTGNLLWFEDVSEFSKQAQQNYYAFDALERHYGLGNRANVDVTVTFYPSGTVVRKNGAAANSTIVIGEDGTNGVVEPPSATSPDGGSLGGASQGGASQGGASQGGASQGGASQGGASQGGASQGGAAGSDASSHTAGGCSCRVGAESASDRERKTVGFVSTLLVLLWARRRVTRSVRSADSAAG
jgi:MYXO-CTERM domain-containing protein